MENDNLPSSNVTARNLDLEGYPIRRFSASIAIGDASTYIKHNPLFFLKFVILTAATITITEGFNSYSKWTDFNYFENLFGRNHNQTLQAFAAWIKTIWWPVAIIGWVLTILATLSIEAMLYRKALFEEETGFLGLLVGKDEIRLAAAKVINAAPFAAFYALLGIIPFLKGANPFVLIMGILALFFFGWVSIWVSLRLYLAAVVSQASKCVNFKEIWEQTKENAWNIFVLQILISLLFLAIGAPLVMVLNSNFETIGRQIEDTSGILSAFTSFNAFLATFVAIVFLSFANYINILISISVYKQMDPDFAPIYSNSPTEIP